jgi:hypothetical protein
MDSNLFMLIQKPPYQALLFLLLTPIIIFAIRTKSVDTAWSIAALMFVVFIIINAGFLWLDVCPWRYFFYSIGVALAYLLLMSVIMPGVISVLQLKGSGESAMAFLVIIYQPFALLLVMLVKWMVTKWF